MGNVIIPTVLVIVTILVLIVFYLILRTKIRGKLPHSSEEENKISSEKMIAEQLLLDAAASYEKVGNIEKAIESYELYLYKSGSNDPFIHFKIGNLYGMERKDAAYSYWKKAADNGLQEAINLIAKLDNKETNSE